MKRTGIHKLTSYEKQKVEDRAFKHWHDQKSKYPPNAEWSDYWRVNKKEFFRTALMFKRMLSENGFAIYLSDHELNGWTIHNIETLNG